MQDSVIEIGSVYNYKLNQADDNNYYLWAVGFVIKNLPTPNYLNKPFPPIIINFFNYTDNNGEITRKFVCSGEFKLSVELNYLVDFGVLFD